MEWKFQPTGGKIYCILFRLLFEALVSFNFDIGSWVYCKDGKILPRLTYLFIKPLYIYAKVLQRWQNSREYIYYRGVARMYGVVIIRALV